MSYTAEIFFFWGGGGREQEPWYSMKKPNKHWLFMVAKYILTKKLVIRRINRVNSPKYENTVIIC